MAKKYLLEKISIYGRIHVYCLVLGKLAISATSSNGKPPESDENVSPYIYPRFSQTRAIKCQEHNDAVQKWFSLYS